MGSRMAQEMIFGPSYFREGWYWSMCGYVYVWEEGGGGGLASREVSANFFPGVLTEIWLIPDLWALYGLLIYATNDHP